MILGAGEYSSLETANIRALLNALATATRFGIQPDGSAVPVQSGAAVTQDGWRILTWGAILGLSFGADAGYPAFSELLANTSWSGYSVYIQTNAPNATELVTSATIPSNSWVSLSGSGAKVFAVASNYDAIGYIRVPSGIPRTIDATYVGSNNNGPWYVIRWTPDAETPYAVSGGLTFYELNNSGHQYDAYTCTFAGSIYRSNDQATNGTSVSSPITIGAAEGVTLYANSPFSITFTPG